MTSGRKADAVEQFGDAEGVARGPGIHIGAAEAEQQADEDHGDGLEQRTLRHHHRRKQTEHHQREILDRRELFRERGEDGREGGERQRSDAAREERAQRGDRERGTGTALARHLVAVEAGDHRGRLARHVDHDGGGRAAVLRAVIDAGEHDQRAQGREPIRCRQQHGDGGDRTNAGEHADQGAQQASRQAEE
jgi:hypothetical protein